MKTRNAMQLKAIIKTKAKELGISPQLVLQDYVLERLLERISLSESKDKIVLKGGMLIASIIGIDSRVTKDLDTTICGFTLTHERIEQVFRDICTVAVDDDLKFDVIRTEDIRGTDDYPGIRVFLKATYAPMQVPLTVDVTTGDAITPSAIPYKYNLIFENRTIKLLAYPVETVLAEKLETVISRGAASTRPRDYYDVHMLWKLRRGSVSLSLLQQALAATATKRDTLCLMAEYREIMDFVAHDQGMQAR